MSEREREKPWRVRLICCGRDDGTYYVVALAASRAFSTGKIVHWPEGDPLPDPEGPVRILPPETLPGVRAVSAFPPPTDDDYETYHAVYVVLRGQAILPRCQRWLATRMRTKRKTEEPS